MIAATTRSQPTSLLLRGLGVLALLWISLLVAGLGVYLRWLSVGLILFAAVMVVSLARPWAGITVALLIVFLFEPFQSDPFMQPGWFLQMDVSSWAPIRYINFSPLELLVLFSTIGVLGRAVIERQWPSLGELRRPIMIFLALVALSLGYGMAQHGDLRTALWETRSLFLGGLIALLIPVLVRSHEQLNRLANLLIVATLLLSLDVIWRRFTMLQGVTTLDLYYAHETPFLMNFVIILILARFIWPVRGTRRLGVLLVPLILFAEALTERRAGWIGLDIGLMMLALPTLKIRPRLFFWVVVPLAAVYMAYVGAFWNNNSGSTISQPARAVHSIFAPNPRDASSDIYRAVETANTRINIQRNKLTGLGFGRPFVWYIAPVADLNFDFYQYITHNAFLWIWMNMGPMGFTALLVLIGAGTARGMQLIKTATRDRAGPMLLACTAGLVMAVVYTYVDISLTNPRLMAFMGLCLGCIAVWARSTNAGAAQPRPLE